jgi:alkaline phosphatase D
MTDSINTKRRDFIVKTTSAAAAVAVGGSLSGCSDSSGADEKFATAPDFTYGVASGDPLTDRIILWTYAKFSGADAALAVPLTWQISTDAAFSNIISSGKIEASEASGFTAKIDATGLNAGVDYFYRFLGPRGASSIIGTTRTLPAANVASVKFAVFSCSLYSEGFFNAYDAAAKSDAQYAIHLGDYIYEYGAAPSAFGNRDAVTLGRVTVPANDIVSLADYRARYALYRSDASARALHAKMPWITIWDDHEFTNNAYVNGAENHNPATQGDWNTRKNIAAKVYHEWMPIRTDNSNLLRIYRSFDFGSLLSLHMLDTRIEGRDQQYDNFGDKDGGIGRYIAGITPTASGTLPDASRRMISTTQQSWLTSQLTASRAPWQFLGNQDIMARMWIPVSVAQYFNPANPNPAAGSAAVQTYLGAKATRAAGGTTALTPTQAALLDPAKNPRLPYNLDSWDGYPANREQLLQSVKSLNKRLIVLSGDSHNGWFTKLTTLAGDIVGAEFAGSSVTSPGFESAGLGGLGSSLDGSALVPQLGIAALGAGLGLIDDLVYSDTIKRGYLQLTVTASSVKGEYIYVSTVKSTTYTTAIGRTITVGGSGETAFG